MKKFFVLGLVTLLAFETANVWFIMPLPFSQRGNSIDLAYALHRWRWLVRLVAVAMMAWGARAVWRVGLPWRTGALVTALVVAAVTYATNFRMAADHMFLQPTTLRMVTAEQNTVARDRLVVGVALNGEARAYPLQFIGYHHQVRDSVGGMPVLVSYCTVCRSGRVFSPRVGEQLETFRLVGMDHFNAMLEDRSTGSWWRQANGEAVTGSQKGQTLGDIASVQVTLAEWLAMYPDSRIMQPDSAFLDEYAKDYAYERGTQRRGLTGTDSASWGEKSWVVGVTVGKASKAFDWNRLRAERVINDRVGTTPVVIVLRNDDASFYAFERPDSVALFTLRGDSIVSGTMTFALNGQGPSGRLTAVQASQEFWHSWRSFQPATERY